MNAIYNALQLWIQGLAMFDSSLMTFYPQKPVLADAISLNCMLPKVLALLNRIHPYIHFQVLPAVLFSNLFTTNARFGG